MSTSKDTLRGWFERGVKAGSSHMVIVCDAYDHDDYPVYCQSEEEAHKHSKDYSNMKRPMECYKLSDDMEEQMKMHRCWRY